MGAFVTLTEMVKPLQSLVLMPLEGHVRVLRRLSAQIQYCRCKSGLTSPSLMSGNFLNSSLCSGPSSRGAAETRVDRMKKRVRVESVDAMGVMLSAQLGRS